MALPAIVFDSATGSDTAASGAGPGDGTTSGSALTGTSASTDGAGTTITLDGSPDLSGVATDGSHVIYLADSTAGKRNFGKITGKDNTAKTVTVSAAFDVSLSGKSWAIGGKRATLDNSNTRKLVNNNTATGDADGWTLKILSDQSLTSAFTTYNVTITIVGPLDGSHPVIDQTANDYTINHSGSSSGLMTIKGLKLTNSNGTKTNAYGLVHGNDWVQDVFAEDVIFGDATNYLAYGAYHAWINRPVVGNFYDCLFQYCTSSGGLFTPNATLFGCSLRNNGVGATCREGSGISLIGCEVTDNTGCGINRSYSGYVCAYTLINCTIANNGSHGVEGNSGAGAGANMSVLNSILALNGGYGIKGYASLITRGNTLYSNTSGDGFTLDSTDSTIDPDFVGSGDYTPQESTLEGTAYPTSIP